jgi:Protein of unknown function (DUF2934)
MAQEKARPTRARKKAEVAPAVDGDAQSAPKKPRARRQPVSTVGSADVATLAYLLWEQGEPGDAMEHWLRAEQEIAA